MLLSRQLALQPARGTAVLPIFAYCLHVSKTSDDCSAATSWIGSAAGFLSQRIDLLPACSSRHDCVPDVCLLPTSLQKQ